MVRKFQVKMRSQRFGYTLPSQDESSLFLDSDNISILSSPYSYPETIFPEAISSELDPFLPYYVYQYPLLEIPAEPMAFVPEFLNLSAETSNTFHDCYSQIENFSNIYGSMNEDTSSYFTYPSYADQIITERIPSCIDPPTVENFNDILLQQPKIIPRITNYGTVSILLRHLIRVDISPAKAVYVTNPPAECIAAVNATGDKSCVIHPNGRVLHTGQDIHMKTLDRQAKICGRGIIFSSTKHCLSYLVDNSGTKTTSENFRNLNNDFSLQVFFCNGVDQTNAEECYKMVCEAQHRSFRNGDEVWIIGGFRIKQDERGNVKVTKIGDHYAIKTSPTCGYISIKTDTAEMHIGRYADNYFSVKVGNKQVSASLKRFVVQNGSQKSGFNSSGKVALF